MSKRLSEADEAGCAALRNLGGVGGPIPNRSNPLSGLAPISGLSDHTVATVCSRFAALHMPQPGLRSVAHMGIDRPQD